MFKLIDHPNHGVILTVDDENVADEFDDFLTERYYVFYEQKLNERDVQFLFGFASSIEKVNVLIEAFNK